MNTKRTTPTEMLLKGLMLFSILTVIQGLDFFEDVNKIWLAVISLVFVLRLLTYRYTVTQFFMLLTTIVIHVFALYFTEFPLFHFNMLFYFALWVMMYVFFSKSKAQIMTILDSSDGYINTILWIWTLLVGVSAFFPSCYKGNYFISLAGTSFRLMPAALIITALAMYMAVSRGKKLYNLFLIVPTYAALMNQSRTYFGVYMLVLLMYLYASFKNKKFFYLLLVPVVIIMYFFVLTSGIAEKFADVWVTGVTTEKFLASFTNMRTTFWEWDIEAFFALPFWQQFVGNGFNFPYDVTAQYLDDPIWAHNDIINLLMNFGYIGVLIYTWSYFQMLKAFMPKNNKIPKIVKFLFHCAVFVNSMFNMSYTYLCAVISYPLFLSVISARYDGSNEKRVCYESRNCRHN